MHEREPTLIRQLLDRLLSVRARRDREVRFSDAWRAADAELHQIERAIFRVPLLEASPPEQASDAQPRAYDGGPSQGQPSATYGSRLAG